MSDNQIFYIYDSPVPYKDLLIYPATVKEYIQFHYYVDCLLLDKNSNPDVNIISMSYLRFLYYISSKGDSALVKLYQLLKMCLKLEDDSIKFYTKQDKAFFSVGKQEYDSGDFDNISKIICEQNCVDTIDENIQKELRDAMDEAKEHRRKMQNAKMCSFEDQLICIMISTPMKLEDVYNLTIRKFSKIIKRIDHKLHYQIYKTASLSGFVTFKTEIKDWMADLENTDKYADVKVDEKEIKDKINLPA